MRLTPSRGLLAALFLIGAASVARAQSPSPAQVSQGKALWAKKACGGCHAFGKKLAGPDLAGVTERRSREWLARWLKDTDQMLGSDSTAQALLKAANGVRMPNQRLADADIDALLAYVTSESAKKK